MPTRKDNKMKRLKPIINVIILSLLLSSIVITNDKKISKAMGIDLDNTSFSMRVGGKTSPEVYANKVKIISIKNKDCISAKVKKWEAHIFELQLKALKTGNPIIKLKLTEGKKSKIYKLRINIVEFDPPSISLYRPKEDGSVHVSLSEYIDEEEDLGDGGYIGDVDACGNGDNITVVSSNENVAKVYGHEDMSRTSPVDNLPGATYYVLYAKPTSVGETTITVTVNLKYPVDGKSSFDFTFLLVVEK